MQWSCTDHSGHSANGRFPMVDWKVFLVRWKGLGSYLSENILQSTYNVKRLLSLQPCKVMQESTDIFSQMECLCVEEFNTFFFGTGASSLPKRRFTLLFIGINYILHQVIAAQITVGWESPAHHSLIETGGHCLGILLPPSVVSH